MRYTPPQGVCIDVSVLKKFSGRMPRTPLRQGVLFAILQRKEMDVLMQMAENREYGKGTRWISWSP